MVPDNDDPATLCDYIGPSDAPVIPDDVDPTIPYPIVLASLGDSDPVTPGADAPTCNADDPVIPCADDPTTPDACAPRAPGYDTLQSASGRSITLLPLSETQNGSLSG